MKNLVIRTLAGLAYLAIMIGCLLWSKYSFLVLMMLITTLMMHEFHKMNMGSAFPVQQLLSVFTGLVFILLMFCHLAFGMEEKFILLVFIPLCVQMSSLLFVKDRSALESVSHSYTSLLYIAFPMALFCVPVFNNYYYSGVILLCYLALVWMSDIGAYVFGMALGQKFGPKLCPGISPKKSWIGAICGFVTTVGLGALMGSLGWLPFGLWHSMAIAAVIDVTGVFGDLIESVWKRHCGLKDSGNVIPGHGGMMDRFDSALVAVPSAVIYMILFNL